MGDKENGGDKKVRYRSSLATGQAHRDVCTATPKESCLETGKDV